MDSRKIGLDGITGTTMGEFDPKYSGETVATGTGYLINYGNSPTTIKVLKSNKKTLFYYWSGNSCFYSLYEGQDEITFTESYNFVEVLEELGMLKK